MPLPPSAVAPTQEDEAPVAAARRTIGAVTDAGPDEDGATRWAQLCGPLTVASSPG